jgi:transposase-like protein
MTRRPLPRCPQPNCTAKSTRCVKHSMLRSRLRSQRRYKCLTCKKTFAANVGTPYHRMRHSPKKFDEVVALAVEGNSKAAIARALDLTPGTVSRWLERASNYATTFSDVKVTGLNPVEFQSDELRAQARNKKQPLWAYTAVEVWSRLWTSTLVGRRTLRNTLHHFRDMKHRCRVPALKS